MAHTHRPEIRALTPAASLALARRYALLKLPYMSTVLYLFRWKQVPVGALPGGSFCGVTDDCRLFYTEELFNHTIQEVGGVLLHECWHVLLKHCVLQPGVNPALANIAMDLAINSMLSAGGVVLPESGMFPGKFGFPEGLAWKQYYQLLLAIAPGSPAADRVASVGSDPFGHCGSVAGNPLSDDLEGDGRAQGGAPGEPGEPSDGGGTEPTPVGGRSPAEITTARLAAARSIASEGDKLAGTVPGDLLKDVLADITAPTIPWTSTLRRLKSTLTSNRRGCTDYRKGGFSRRIASYMHLPPSKRPVLMHMVDPVASFVVAIDTSGSMTDELTSAVSEAKGILSASDEPVTIVTCDCAVQETGLARSWRDISRLLKGGGGTSMRPIFQWLAGRNPKVRPPRNPTALIVFTDGYFPADFEDPGIPTIWVLVGDTVTDRYISFGTILRTHPSK